MNEERLNDLCLAIIRQAVEDYRTALRVLKAPEYVPERALYQAQNTQVDCETFFTGEWFMVLCDYSGKRIMNLVREQEGYPKIV